MIRGDSITRKINYYSQGVDDLQYETERRKPTQKQKNFFKVLVAKCKEHDIDVAIGKHLNYRVDYADGIGLLLDRLEEAGIPVRKSEEEFYRLLIVEDNPETGRVVKERLVPHNDMRKKPGVDYGMSAAARYAKKEEKP